MGHQRRKQRGSGNGAVFFMGILAVLMIFSVVLLFLPVEEQKNPENKKTPTPTTIQKERKLEEVYAVVLGMDKENRFLSVHMVETGEKKNLVYTGGTVFYDSYGTQVVAGQLEIGGLYCFTVDVEEEYITTGKAAIDRSEKRKEDGTWEKTGVDSISFSDGKISLRNQNYRPADGLCVMNNGREITIADINPKTDILTVRGKESYVYEIVVTKGHGTIALENFEDFVGGTIVIGNTRIDSVTETGTYVVREGTYNVQVTNGEYSGTEQLTVKRDETTVFDLYEYGRGPIQTCFVTFYVEPLGATLYIDGKKTAYTDGIELDYGTYKIEYAEGGYISYTATLRVEEPTLFVSVYLKEKEVTPTPTNTPTPTPTPEPTEALKPTEIPQETLTPTPTVEPTLTPTPIPEPEPTLIPEPTPEVYEQTSVSIQGLGDYKLATDYAVYIVEPEGAEVYLDGVYLGKVPIDFEKIIGEYTITIKKPDGSTFEYSLNGYEDGMDGWYAFP